ncbi:MAG: 4'-phosphopantetheinyl transferase superfamily protein [Desulfobulbaceae bacterium]|uniref:4'-phosphopantetheinyl transferase superfamily protein n=1 Tax=Candidatus Desulfobia pelagia TaxID=2841692 RepID=A0A8J6NCG6_9BACT|nr:4'-phosphopantetheinyl transferase superfamily protein [Candidatus Desulfobia pelagia]
MISDITPLIAASFREEKNLVGKYALARVDISLLQEHIEKQNALLDIYLSREEKEVFCRFSYPKRKFEWLGGRIAAKYAAILYTSQILCENVTKTQWHSIEVSQDTHRKPFLKSSSDLLLTLPHISISHSHGLALGLASCHPCGVDVQEITRAIERVESRFVTPEEKKLLRNYFPDEEHTRKGLSLIWSAKEAIKKASTLQPLPGFLEISLKNAVKKDGYQLEMFFSRNKNQQSSFHRVFTILYDEYTLALTLNETKPC